MTFLPKIPAVRGRRKNNCGDLGLAGKVCRVSPQLLYSLTMRLGNKLTIYLLLGVFVGLGLDVYLSLNHIRTNLLKDLHSEVASISRTLRIALEKAGNPGAEQYFVQIATEISGFENIRGLVFFDHEGQETWRSQSLRQSSLPQVNVRAVVTTQTPVEGLYREGSAEKYYWVEPIRSPTGEDIAAFLVLENTPLFTRKLQARVLEVVLASLVLLAVLASIMSAVIRRSVAQPLQTITRHIKRLGRDNLLTA